MVSRNAFSKELAVFRAALVAASATWEAASDISSVTPPAYLGIVTASLGMLIFIPQIIKSLGGYSNMTVGWLTMIPYICGAIAMVVWGRISDRMNERRWNLFIACVFSTVGLVIAGMTMGTWWALVGMSIAAMGFYGSKGPFFAMPPMFLSGAGLAAGIAWINSIGNLGGFFGPWYVGVMKDLTGSYAGGLYGLALLGRASQEFWKTFKEADALRVAALKASNKQRK